jgi:L-aminopeptidase/D-esterase-like protein
MAPFSNDTLSLRPQTELRGPVLELDFPGLEIGCAEYEEGPTGCTVFHFPARASLETDVRGGSPGTFAPGWDCVDAITFAGGSLYGLEAATGVAAELLSRREYRTGWLDIPLVAGAVIYDWSERDNAIYPDHKLGRAAMRAARPGAFPIGRRGAGRSATVGKISAAGTRESAGQGAAFRRIGDARIAVFTVVNAAGAVVGRDGTVVRGHLDPATGTRRSILGAVEERLAASLPVDGHPGNTTLTLVATNVALDPPELRALARQVHASMARAIQPFHARDDGDVLYAVSTNAVETDALVGLGLGVVASELAWDAVLAACEVR